ncbi:Vacuolar morphogenesis protein 6 [Myotisia sp. PD_48]|nr:Vacuolar morphogenesis protein 6 [Myotisia sp. PD_48]
MLTAFTACPLVELRQRDKSKIESILTYGDRLLVGLNTGCLRIYRVNEVNDEDAATPAPPTTDPPNAPSPVTPKINPTDLLREEEKFARHKIEQLAIIKEANVLLSLSNGHVSIHDLQTYELHRQLTTTKGVTTFAVTSNIITDPDTGVPLIVSRLAVSLKRKLLLWTWQDMEMQEGSEEITLVSGIKTITWVTGTKLVAGLVSTYVLVDIINKEVMDIVGPGSIGGGLGGQETGKFGGVGVASMSYIGMGGAAPRPLATRLCEGQVLLAKDVNTHFIDTDGNSLGRRQIPWTGAPEAIGYSYPYLLTLKDPARGTLEVRNPETLTLLQSIPLASATMMHIPQPNISLAHAGKGFLIASGRVIWRMSALGYDTQIETLVDKGHLDEAISLLEMLEDALVVNKANQLREIKLQKAQVLFGLGKYRDSMDLFRTVLAPPDLVLRRYPRLIAGDLSLLEEDSQSEREASPTPDQVNGNGVHGSGDSMLEDKGKSKNATYAPSVRSFLRTKTDDSSETGSIQGKAVASAEPEKRLEGKDLKSAVHELQGYLVDIRSKLSKFLNKDGTLKFSSSLIDGKTDAHSETLLQILGIPAENMDEADIGQRLRETAKLVDTTLFRAYMFANPKMAGPLFRLENFCDPDVVMEKLEQTGRYSDLIDFLFGKKLHRAALERLRKFGQKGTIDENAPQLQGPERTIAYLQNLPPEMIDLILEFAEWPLRANPKLGMEIFLADTENAETLPHERVLKFLEPIDAKLAAQYAEHVIEDLNDMTPDIHQKLLILYLEQLLKIRESGEGDSGRKEREVYTRKLLDMLETSAQYSPARMLDRLPRDDPDLYEARAITLSKMGQHRQALEIYVFKLDDPTKAEDYCNRVHLKDDMAINQRSSHATSSSIELEDRPSIYHTLLSLYLSPPHGYKPQYSPAIEILARHGSRLPANSTLALIPESLPVNELEFYFRGRIRAANSIMRDGKILAGLRKVQTMTVEAELSLGDELAGNNGRNRSITVTEDRVCGICHKRLGGSVISVFPDNTVVHLGCANRLGAGA